MSPEFEDPHENRRQAVAGTGIAAGAVVASAHNPLLALNYFAVALSCQRLATTADILAIPGNNAGSTSWGEIDIAGVTLGRAPGFGGRYT